HRLARHAGTVLHAYPARRTLGAQRLRRDACRRHTAAPPGRGGRDHRTRGCAMTAGAAAQDWHQILARRSFLAGDALERATALLVPDSVRVLCGPFDRLESPWLEPQGIVPQADDGVVIARGARARPPAPVRATPQGF